MKTQHRFLLSLPLLLSSAACAVGCTSAVDPDDGEGESASALKSAVSCSEQNVTGYASGKSYAMQVITLGGKKTAQNTAHAFLKLQAAADKAGVSLSVNSGFRSMSEQQYLYNCYLTKKCNSGNLAAKPGYSNHQNGRALDIGASNYTWLKAHAGTYGFKATVPSERWHYEFSGADPGGPCSAGGSSSTEPMPDQSDDSETDQDDADTGSGSSSSSSSSSSGSSGSGCYSPTLKETMDEASCVRSTADDVMYQCHEGLWYRGVSASGKGPFGTCASVSEP